MCHVVAALVASAGGLAAVRAVLETLPAEVPATVLVVIHQEPDRESRLPQLLARHTFLTVRQAAADDDLAVGEVLVAPPGRRVLVTPAGRLAPLESRALPPNWPSADRASSQDFGMPSAAIGRDDVVDVTLDVTAIGPHLEECARSRVPR